LRAPRETSRGGFEHSPSSPPPAKMEPVWGRQWCLVDSSTPVARRRRRRCNHVRPAGADVRSCGSPPEEEMQPHVASRADSSAPVACAPVIWYWYANSFALAKDSLICLDPIRREAKQRAWTACSFPVVFLQNQHHRKLSFVFPMDKSCNPKG
jgi:hypothetical protein